MKHDCTYMYLNFVPIPHSNDKNQEVYIEIRNSTNNNEFNPGREGIID